MSTELKAPTFPESVEEGTLTTWYKKEGDAVTRHAKVADIETDKIVLEVVAPASGVLRAVTVREGDVIKAQQVLARIEAGEDAADKAPAHEPPPPKNPDAKPAETEKATTMHLAPAVRRMVEEHGLDVGEIEGTGRGDMITKADVLRYLETRASAPPPTDRPAPKRAEEPVAPVSAPPPGDPDGVEEAERPEKRVPMTRIRARIAERLLEAKRNTALLTTFNEINMQPVMELRNRYKDIFEKNNGVKLGFMSFFVKAAVEALKRFPVVNATLDGSDIVYHGYYDIGVAVGTERGLVVPIVRDADQLSYAGIEKAIVDFADRAQNGKLGMNDLTGGTFSITNGGVFGSLLSTPIVNPPQSAILGMHKIEERPVAEKGQVVIRPMMYVALSYDHRLIDGRDAVRFLVTIKEHLEDPARMLLAL